MDRLIDWLILFFQLDSDSTPDPIRSKVRGGQPVYSLIPWSNDPDANCLFELHPTTSVRHGSAVPKWDEKNLSSTRNSYLEWIEICEKKCWIKEFTWGIQKKIGIIFCWKCSSAHVSHLLSYFALLFSTWTKIPFLDPLLFSQPTTTFSLKCFFCDFFFNQISRRSHFFHSLNCPWNDAGMIFILLIMFRILTPILACFYLSTL